MIIAQIHLKDAQEIVSSPIGLSLVVLALVFGFIFLYKNLQTHIKECASAAKVSAEALTKLNLLLTANQVTLNRVDANCISAIAKSDHATERIARLEGAIEHGRREN